MYCHYPSDVENDSSDTEKSLNSDEVVSTSSDEDKSLKRETKREKDNLPMVEEWVGSFLSSTPPVIEKIFQNLGARDLNKCARVCSTWSKIVGTEKQKRLAPSTYFQTIDKIKKVDPEETDFVCKFATVFVRRLDIALKNSFIEPNVVLIFICSMLSSRKQSVNDVRWMLEKLPRQCSALCMSSYGVIGTPVNKIWPYESYNKPTLSALFFPKNIPGVQLYPFEIPFILKRPIDGPENLLNEDQISKITGVPQISSVKCLLLFGSFFPPEHRHTRWQITTSIADYFLKGCNYQIAVGGSIGDEVSYKYSERLTVRSGFIGAGLAIVGDVNAASVLVPIYKKSKDQILDKLKELKNGITLKKYSIAFLFPCCVGFSKDFEDKEVQIKLFSQVFPGVRMVGMFGNRKLGINYFPNETIPNEEKLCTNGITSVFVIVILSWNGS